MLEGQRDESLQYTQHGDVFQIYALLDLDERTCILQCHLRTVYFQRQVIFNVISNGREFILSRPLNHHLSTCGVRSVGACLNHWIRTAMAVMLSLLFPSAFSYRVSTNDFSHLSVLTPSCSLPTSSQMPLISSLLNASNSPSLPSSKIQYCCLSCVAISGTALIMPGSPPYFLSLAYGSPMVRVTFRLPGSTRICRKSLMWLRLPSCYRYILPPCFIIRSFSPVQCGLWSRVSSRLLPPPSSTALLSPKLATTILPPKSRHTTAHDPLVSPGFASHKLRNFSQHFSKVSRRASQGLLSSILDLARKRGKCSLRNSAQLDPP